jgi:hypothetical protein
MGLVVVMAALVLFRVDSTGATTQNFSYTKLRERGDGQQGLDGDGHRRRFR